MPITLNGSTFNNGGTANFNNGTNYSLNEIKFSGYTVWKKEIKLMDDTSAWTLVPINPDAADSQVAEFSNGVLTCKTNWWLPGGPIAYAERKLTPCDNVSKISFDFQNSAQGFAKMATYIGIVSRGGHYPYYGSGNNAGGSDRGTNNPYPETHDDALWVGSTRMIIFPTNNGNWTVIPGAEEGGTAHRTWVHIDLNFGSPMNLTNYYFIVSTAVQGNNSSDVSITNLIAT